MLILDDLIFYCSHIIITRPALIQVAEGHSMANDEEMAAMEGEILKDEYTDACLSRCSSQGLGALAGLGAVLASYAMDSGKFLSSSIAHRQAGRQA